MGEARLAERVDFGRGLLLLATALDRELDEPQIGVYWHALKAIPAEIRRETLARASEQKWFRFPQPGELKILAARVVDEKRAAAARLHLADCPHSGHWIEDARGLSRCSCWRRAMTAMSNVGARVALPAAAEGSADHV